MKTTYSSTVPKELSGGLIIFAGVAFFFLLMEFLNLSHVFYLRLLNVFFIFYGVNRILNINLSQGQNNFLFNAVSAMITSFIGVVLSLAALMMYSYARGGDHYVESLSQTFMFGAEPSVPIYILCLLFEGSASCIVVTLVLMLCRNSRFRAD
ncbi:hypothetical protein NYQ10_20720 [Flavobacterium johnsoniae]|uniref:hypothetical protein n=1 Tax=Flavobacterium TaxID=237 RepID=UPI0015C1BB87|nr:MULTISPECIES: hypothetical protein [Flavobacterium]NWL02852.1 hypothetical protein [Flavobacterium collinsii]WET04022.1 hypothetical protein P0R33_06690 [Flavobacterium sp. YJ01]WJS94509.1 hypothetical protein NYQ10_20720 [Flavobacterium johnsoniae]